MKKPLCPNCGSEVIFEEVRSGVTALVLITFDKDGGMKLGIPGIVGTPSEQYYQCTTCGHVLEGVTGLEDLKEWVEGGSE